MRINFSTPDPTQDILWREDFEDWRKKKKELFFQSVTLALYLMRTERYNEAHIAWHCAL